MKRRTNTLPARIWTYGCQPPEPLELFNAQLLAAHRYYNTLIEIERWRREEYRKARTAVADIGAIEQAVKEVSDEIDKERAVLKAARSSERRRVELPELRARVKELQLARKPLYAALKEARVRVREDEALKAESKRIDAEASVKGKEARAATTTYWGTYLLIEKAIEAARGAAVDPEFHRWRGEGRVGVQLHHDKFEDIMAGRCTMLRITLRQPRGASAATTGAGNSKRSQKRFFADVEIRVGSTGRAPIWVKLGVILHRLPPPDTTVAWAWIKVTKIGADVRYELQLVLESEAFGEIPKGKGVAAIDLGWRVMPSGDLRVAYLHDDVGRERELVLPARLLSKLRYCDELRGYQTKHFDVAREAWIRWLNAYAETPGEDGPLPDWLEEIRKLLPHWRSPARMAKAVGTWVDHLKARTEVDRLWELWMKERLAQRRDFFDTLDAVARWTMGKTDLFPTLVYMEWWRRKNRHLHDWEEHQRHKTLGWRREIYRRFAADMARTYETVVLEDMDLRSLARNAKPEADVTLDHFHRIRNIAAPGELRGCLLSAMGQARNVAKPTKNTTRECAGTATFHEIQVALRERGAQAIPADECRHINDWPDKERSQRVLKCAKCGIERDQDSNAARVLLRRYFEDFGADGSPGGAREGSPDAGSTTSEPSKKEVKTRAKKNRSQTGAQDAGIAGP